jgi:hypothetical protein
MRRREGVWPILMPIPGLTASDVQEDLHRIHREFNEQMEIERRAARAARANDPHRCHCPFCTVIG